MSQRIRFLGIGTQRIAEDLTQDFPRARPLRWDRDVTRGKHSHEEILDRFLAHEADVLVGTQDDGAGRVDDHRLQSFGAHDGTQTAAGREAAPLVADAGHVGELLPRLADAGDAGLLAVALPS